MFCVSFLHQEGGPTRLLNGNGASVDPDHAGVLWSLI